MTDSLFMPQWCAPQNVRAIISTRHGGESAEPFNSLNVATHVGDDKNTVLQNRRYLQQCIGQAFGHQPNFTWLDQVHGTDILDVTGQALSHCKADASYTRIHSEACAVLTADCLPVLFCNTEGTEVAAAHAGWRGLANGILTKAVQRFQALPEDIHAYLGPAISQSAFQVGPDVKQAFQEAGRARHYAQAVDDAFIIDSQDKTKYKADLYSLARSELQGLGIGSVEGGEYCTYAQADTFYSYRRQSQTGRMVTAIWIAPIG